jgi:hypothetical protein
MAFLPRTVSFVVPLVFFAGSAFAQTSPKGCPAGQRPSLSGCIDGSSQARIRKRPEAGRKAKTPPRVPKPDPALSIERAKTPPIEHRRKALLIRELQQLEAMLERTRENSPDELIILRRLADGYAELEAIAERDRARAQAAADDIARAERAAPRPTRPKKRGEGTIL